MSFSISQATCLWAEQKKLSVWYQSEVGSTNDRAKETLNHDLYICDHQTRGRGRGENTWTDTKEGQLLSSWHFRLHSAPQHITAPLVGLALWSAARSTWADLAWSLKAPNDLYLENGKVAGLLIESLSQGQEHHLIIGLGMNIFSGPSEVDFATHLSHSINVTKEKWFSFLETLQQSLSKGVASALTPKMSSEDRTNLKEALNLWPHLKNEIIEIDSDGNLHSNCRVQPWTEL